MNPRTCSDVLREEYFSLLPHIRRTLEEVEAEVRHLLVPIVRRLASHERIVVRSRIKECESAIAALRRRDQWHDIDSAVRSLTALNDLAGVRVLAFPKQRVIEIDNAIRTRFADWVADPVPPLPGTANSLAFKYHGYCSSHCTVRSEIQVMSLLLGMFWEVEHTTLYKPGPELRGLELSLKMEARYADVVQALDGFEREFEIQAQSAVPAAQATADFNTLCG